jgi:exopolysaccharide production protein ExoQ
MRVLIKLLNDIFTLAVLFLSTGAFLPLIMGTSQSETLTKGTVAIQGAWALIYIFATLRALPHYRQIAEFIGSNKLLVCLLVLTLLSSFWSEEPGITLRRSIALVGTMLVGVDLALRYSIRNQLRMLCFVLGSVVLLSVIVQVLWPGAIRTIDVVQSSGWNGAFNQKNVFGRIIVLTTIAFLANPSGRWKPLRNGLAICCGVALIVASHSMGGLVVLATLLSFLGVYRILASIRHLRIAYLLSVAFGLMASSLLYLVISNLDSVTRMLGRDPTLTGRVKLWRLAFASFLRQPLFGYGYSGFWNVSSDALHINRVLYWTVPHAHNGFLDLALELGLVGLFLYLTYYVVLVHRAFDYARNRARLEGMWIFAYLAFAFLYSVTESSTLAANSIFGIMFASVACSVAGVPVVQPDEHEESLEEQVLWPHVSYHTSRMVNGSHSGHAV